MWCVDLFVCLFVCFLVTIHVENGVFYLKIKSTDYSNILTSCLLFEKLSFVKAAVSCWDLKRFCSYVYVHGF